MKTTATAINKVYSILSDVATGLSVPVFKRIKPVDTDDVEYVVVKALPINAGVMQRCIVNVNYHVADYAGGIPDIDKLETGEVSVINLLDETVDQVSDEIDIMIDFSTQEMMNNEELKEHYSNMRFLVRIINKQ